MAQQKTEKLSYEEAREGNGNPPQYSCLENTMDRGAWRATVHGIRRVRHNLATKPSYEVVGKHRGVALLAKAEQREP